MTLPLFHIVGKCPFSKRWLKRSVRCLRSLLERCRSTVVEMPLWPGADRDFRERILCFNSYGFVSCRGGGSVGSYYRKTSLQNEIRK